MFTSLPTVVLITITDVGVGAVMSILDGQPLGRPRPGRDIVTDAKLTTADRTDGVLGAVTLVSLILGARSAIKGPPGGAYVRPGGEVPGWSALGALGRAWAGARAVAGEIA